MHHGERANGQRTSRQAPVLPSAVVPFTMRGPAVSKIAKVWIEAGCISCKLCQDIAPKVFLVDDDRDCVVKVDAAAQFAALREDIEQAARDCPVEVIKLEHAP